MKATATVTTGDMRLLTAALPENSIDAVVTDPPYELNFMSAKWDNSGIAFSVETWREVYRALKPGGYLLAFGAPRTYHRMAVAIEDAGFEIRDSLMWITGQGFPKSLDVAKAIDKAAGELGVQSQGFSVAGNNGRKAELNQTLSYRSDYGYKYTPATDDARRWNGWGTATKPSHEPVIVARKPFAGTVADNVQAWGTGAINIDACRVEGEELRPQKNGISPNTGYRLHKKGNEWNPSDKGRWPSNILFDNAAAEALDAQSGQLTSGNLKPYTRCESDYWLGGTQKNTTRTGDTGGASRFFPVLDYEEGEICPFFYTPKASQSERHAGTTDGNNHPTVKPLAVMQWLCRLVTQPGGTVLDPFAGSGTTGVACLREGFHFIGFELREEAASVARERIAAAFLPPAPRSTSPRFMPAKMTQANLFSDINAEAAK